MERMNKTHLFKDGGYTICGKGSIVTCNEDIVDCKSCLNGRRERMNAFVITKGEIEKMLIMAKRKNDNLFVLVIPGSLGCVLKIKPQSKQLTPFRWKPDDKDWENITDYDSW